MRKNAQEGSHKIETGSEMAAMFSQGESAWGSTEETFQLEISTCLYIEPSNQHQSDMRQVKMISKANPVPKYNDWWKASIFSSFLCVLDEITAMTRTDKNQIWSRKFWPVLTDSGEIRSSREVSFYLGVYISLKKVLSRSLQGASNELFKLSTSNKPGSFKN